MTGITAEKHDSFIAPIDDGSSVILEFSGKELIKGEPDASSFPSGGLRATFEARGYTAWDPSSYAFIKDNTLCIPTAFCSYGGEALDKKTPLLRSMEAINKQALRVLTAFRQQRCYLGVPHRRGRSRNTFLWINSIMTNARTLYIPVARFSALCRPKGQEMDDHYFGVIKSPA